MERRTIRGQIVSIFRRDNPAGDPRWSWRTTVGYREFGGDNLWSKHDAETIAERFLARIATGQLLEPNV